MKVKRKRALAALLAVAAALAVGVSVAGTASAATKGSIVIGWAYDSKGNMSPFDGPALAAAQVRVKQVNARGGGQLKIITCDTQNNNPAKAKACALSLLGQGANVIFTTCDVDYATPVVQEAINRGCSRSPRASAPIRWAPSASARRASWRSASATSRRTRARRWRSGPTARAGTRPTRAPTRARLLQERRAGVRGPLQAARRQDRRPRDLRDGANNVSAAVSRLNGKKADVYVDRRHRSASSPRSSRACARSATTRRSSTRGPATAPTGCRRARRHELLRRDLRLGVRRRPEPGASTSSPRPVKAGTGGFVTGAAAIDGLAAASRQRRQHDERRGARGEDGRSSRTCRPSRAWSASRPRSTASSGGSTA